MNILTKQILISLTGLLYLVNANAVTIGQTYPIIEPDALEEIKSKAGQINWEDQIKQGRKSGLNSIELPYAEETLKRTYVPLYRAPFDVADPKSGKLLYPKGYQYNILDYVRMPFRIVVFKRKHVDWIKNNALKTDVLILADKGLFEVQNKLNRAVYILDEKTQQRLHLRFALSVVTQNKNHFIIEEIKVDADATS